VTFDAHLPADGAPTAAAVVLHPHPGMGGDRHHPLMVAVAERLAAVGVAAWRVDLTDPDPERATPQLEDVAARLLDDVGVDRLLLVGYSWGAGVSARAEHAALVARVLVAPPVSMLQGAPMPTVPTLVLVPAHDQFGPPDGVAAATTAWPDTTIEVVEGTDHFLAGAVDRIADRAVGWATAR
jgi:alpha/beta superfamily hydrolase